MMQRQQQRARKHLLEGMPQTDPVSTTEDAAAVKSDHAVVEAVDDTKSAEASDNGDDASSPEKAPAASADTTGAQTPAQHSYSLRSRARGASQHGEAEASTEGTEHEDGVGVAPIATENSDTLHATVTEDESVQQDESVNVATTKTAAASASKLPEVTETCAYWCDNVLSVDIFTRIKL